MAPMITRSELYLPVDGTSDKLFLQKWNNPSENEKGIVVITHGVAEHSDCHHSLAETLAHNGYTTYGWDLPGHGKSYGKRGYIKNFDEFSTALNLVLDNVHLKHRNANIFMFGHSLGGLITLYHALQYPEAPSCALCLSSPALGVAMEVPKIKDQAARILNTFAPKITIPHEINYYDLSRDHELIETYFKDPLRHKKFSAPLYLGTLEAMATVLNKADQLQKPLFIQAAGVDRVTDTSATERFYQKLTTQNKALKIYNNSFHEIFNDLDKKEVIDDLMKYLREFLNENH